MQSLYHFRSIWSHFSLFLYFTPCQDSLGQDVIITKSSLPKFRIIFSLHSYEFNPQWQNLVGLRKEKPCLVDIKFVSRKKLDITWQEGFEGLGFTSQEDGTAILTGIFENLTALVQVLNQIRNLMMELVSFTYTEVPGALVTGSSRKNY
jgi:hypothetical protein